MVPNRATQSHIQSSLNWRTGKGNSKKSIMPKKHERHKTADPVDTRRRVSTADKETVFLAIAEHIESHSDEQFDTASLPKLME